MADPRNNNLHFAIITSIDEITMAINLYIINRQQEINNNEGNRRDAVLQYIKVIYDFLNLNFNQDNFSAYLQRYTKQVKPENRFLANLTNSTLFSETDWFQLDILKRINELDRKFFIDFKINSASLFGKNLMSAINATKENIKKLYASQETDLSLPQDLLSTIVSKLSPAERGAIRKVNRKMRDATDAEKIWQEDIKRDFPEAKLIKNNTAKQQYIRLFKNQHVIYLTLINAHPNSILECLRKQLAKLQIQGVEGINQMPIGMTEKTPFNFSELPQFANIPKNANQFALEIQLSKTYLDELLKSGKIEDIFKRTTGMIRFSWPQNSVLQECYNQDGTLIEDKFNKIAYTISPAKVVEGKLIIEIETHVNQKMRL